MSEDSPSRTVRGAAALQLDERVAARLHALLPSVAAETVAAVTAEIPSYVGAFSGQMGAKIESAVRMALGGFLTLASRSRGGDPSTPLGPALEAAYSLGRGEARSGRSMDALLAAYRVGARVSWRELSAGAVEAGIPVETMAKFAELVFAYIDELSAASVAGHADELATTGRVRERYLERLGHNLLAGASAEVLLANAERADWPTPTTLTAVLLPTAHLRGAISLLDQRTLVPQGELPGLADTNEIALMLVPDTERGNRQRLWRILHSRQAVVGPPRPWMQAVSSYRRALRTHELGLGSADDPAATDSEEHLADLLLAADPEALRDLRERVLAPLADLRPATVQRLAETLRSWLLHLGRRDAVAADLHVHAQTVRYRMGQLRERYGDRLDDPDTVLELTVALATQPRPATSATPDGG